MGKRIRTDKDWITYGAAAKLLGMPAWKARAICAQRKVQVSITVVRRHWVLRDDIMRIVDGNNPPPVSPDELYYDGIRPLETEVLKVSDALV